MTDKVFKQKAPIYMAKLLVDIPEWNRFDAAACMGNAGAESGGLTNLQEDRPTVRGSRGGYGWFQWTGPRRRAFERWCKEKGLKPSSDEANYGFLIEELQGSEKAAVKATSQAKKLDDKVVAFELSFERAGIKRYSHRKKYALLALQEYDRLNGIATDAVNNTNEVESLDDINIQPVPTPVVVKQNWFVRFLKWIWSLI